MDYYEILGVSRNSDPVEIKSAFRKLAKKYHPDVNKTKEAENMFQLIYIAYEILSDSLKREIYNKRLDFSGNEERLNGWTKKAGHHAKDYAQMRYEEFDNSLFSKIEFHGRQLISLITFFIFLCVGFIALGGSWYIQKLPPFNGSILISLLLVIVGLGVIFIAIKALWGIFNTWKLN